MPIIYKVDHDARIVIAAGQGKLTDADVFEYQRDVWSRADVTGYNELVDMRGVTEIALPSVERVRALAELAAKMDDKVSHSRLAIVAPDDLAFGLGRMFQSHRELVREFDGRGTKEVGVFRTMEEALVFLHVDHPVVVPEFK
jgi:hypothetical protein